MKLPLSWLEEWVEVALPADELASRMTLAGFEVEGNAPAAPPFTKVVVAEILEAVRHPQADKLQVCRVATGAGAATLQIVCGAANARAGIRVALAQVGAVLPGDLAIQAAALRGVESQGMLCSAKELGPAQSSEGILELPADAPLGASLRDYLQLDDRILEVSIYPNRGDAMSVVGLAREVSALLRRPLKGPALAPVPATIDATHAVRVEAPQANPKMLTRVVSGVSNRGATPAWMQERLRRSGLRPISPVVDVTNYVMLELGQPMHAWDRSRLAGGMHVRLARAGERLVLLDGRAVELEPDVLVIADSEKAIGMAGVMGGEGTSITEDVTDVLLEVAYFTPAAIAGRGRRHGLVTDASQRFERGVDPAGQERAMERATELLLSICGGRAGPVQATVAPGFSPQRPPVTLRRSRLAKLAGTTLPDADVATALAALQMPAEAVAEGWRVTPPSWRFDISIEPDLVEEVLRLVGYDRVPEVPSAMPQRFRRRPESRPAERTVLEALTARGYQEALNYAFCDPALQQRLFPAAQPIRLANPIASDLAEMRVSLWPGLLRLASENQRRQQDRIRLFELGSVFLRRPEGGVVEPRRVAGIVLGSRLPEQWGAAAELADYYDVKGDVEALLSLGFSVQAFEFKQESIACLHPGRSSRIYRDGAPVGWIGELHPIMSRELDFPAAPLLFELELEPATLREVPQFRAISRFPAVRRDLAVTVPDATPLRLLVDRARFAGGELLRDLRVFDVYRGAGIESGRKSIAFGLILQDNDKTLRDEEADGLVARVAADLAQNLDAKIRD